jgi:SAM-dependent methyltransferase
MSISPCKICGNTDGNVVHQVKEMQLGLREIFDYLECRRCGCMQLMIIPADLGKYYPNDNYYSFHLKLDVRKKADSLRRIKSSYLLFGKHRFLGKLLSLGYKLPDYYKWMKNTGVQYDDAILDVGTGNGSLLLNLFKIGFTDLTGIDPFIEKEQQYGSIQILRKDIFQVEKKYSLVMLHHAFEHMDEPLKVLKQLKSITLPDHYIIIRIPLMQMYGWKTYGLNWVGLDAPRHIYIHTIESMKILAEQAGLELKQIDFDSGPYHMWASEQYRKDVALMEPNSYEVNKTSHLFNQEQMEEFKKIAKRTNEECQGDQAAFYLFNKA